MSPELQIAAVLAGAVVAGAAFFFVGRGAERRRAERAGRSASAEAERIVAAGRHEAEVARQEAAMAARADLLAKREEFDRDVERRREELDTRERRLEDRESGLELRATRFEDRDRELGRRDAMIADRERQTAARASEIDKLHAEELQRLERVAGLSAEAAKAELVQRVVDEARAEAAALARDLKEQAKHDADREARKIVAVAIQRLASEYTTESTVSTVELPNDEMKGRIIGREGRNIRAFETATGVDVIIDDTPDTVVVSCFDPVRREVARIALERLIGDGRIHPGRIEEIVKKAQGEVDKSMQEAAEHAAYETGVHGLHAELLKLVGRMKYRTSYGQNLLAHSVEVAWLAGMMASELKLDASVAKRGALLHDIGKVLTHEHEGTHVQLGVEVATKYGESAVVINCIAAHHDDVPHESPISVLVQAADAVSGSRPGARREALETYVKRLARIEEISKSFDGVEKCYAIQAGREVRVVVRPEAVDDGRAAELADTIARRIEGELQYPGQIKVVVIRETRAVDFAR